jgi:hypothetical protein
MSEQDSVGVETTFGGRGGAEARPAATVAVGGATRL